VADLELPAELAELGYLRELPAKESGPAGGRPPSPTYAVHPDYRGEAA